MTRRDRPAPAPSRGRGDLGPAHPTGGGTDPPPPPRHHGPPWSGGLRAEFPDGVLDDRREPGVVRSPPVDLPAPGALGEDVVRALGAVLQPARHRVLVGGTQPAVAGGAAAPGGEVRCETAQDVLELLLRTVAVDVRSRPRSRVVATGPGPGRASPGARWRRVSPGPGRRCPRSRTRRRHRAAAAAWPACRDGRRGGIAAEPRVPAAGGSRPAHRPTHRRRGCARRAPPGRRPAGRPPR